MSREIKCLMEIDDKGVVYVRAIEGPRAGATLMRIQGEAGMVPTFDPDGFIDIHVERDGWSIASVERKMVGADRWEMRARRDEAKSFRQQADDTIDAAMKRAKPRLEDGAEIIVNDAISDGVICGKCGGNLERVTADGDVLEHYECVGCGSRTIGGKVNGGPNE